MEPKDVSHLIRYQRAWCLLSLDCVEPLWEDLWVPVEDRHIMVPQLRGHISTLIETAPDGDQVDLLRWDEPLSWYSGAFGEDQAACLRVWIDKVFILEGSSRSQESTWYRAVQRLSRDFEGLDDLLAARLVDIVQRHRAAMILRYPNIDAIEDGSLSEWDVSAVRPYWSDRASLRTNILLIIRYNVFAEIWHPFFRSLAPEDVRAIWAAAKSAFKSSSDDSAIVEYPRDWYSELHVHVP